MNWVNILVGTGVLALIALVLGVVLALASKYLKAKNEDTRIAEVTAMLPGYNCGSCGYAGCNAFANALVNKEANAVSLCRPSKQDARDKIISYLASTPGPNGETISVK